MGGGSLCPSWSPWMSPCCSRSPMSMQWPPWRRSSRSRVSLWGAPGGSWGGGGGHRGGCPHFAGEGEHRGVPAMEGQKAGKGWGGTTHRGPQGCLWSPRGSLSFGRGPCPLGGGFGAALAMGFPGCGPRCGPSAVCGGSGGPQVCPSHGGSPQIGTQHWRVWPPQRPPQLSLCMGVPAGFGGGPQVDPMGISGVLSTALPIEVCPVVCRPPPPVVPPYGIWETPGLSLEGGSWGGRGPQVCPFNGVLGMGGVSKSVPAMNGVLGWGDL